MYEDECHSASVLQGVKVEYAKLLLGVPPRITFAEYRTAKEVFTVKGVNSPKLPGSSFFILDKE